MSREIQTKFRKAMDIPPFHGYSEPVADGDSLRLVTDIAQVLPPVQRRYHEWGRQFLPVVCLPHHSKSKPIMLCTGRAHECRVPLQNRPLRCSVERGIPYLSREKVRDMQTTCSMMHCDNKFDTDVDDYHASDFVDGIFCWSCYESDTYSASTMIQVTPEGRTTVTFGDIFAYDENGETPDWFKELFPKDFVGRHYVRSDAWRGYFNTTKDLVGVIEITNGWTTGWADDAHARKDKFNQWVADLMEGKEIVTPAPIYLLIEPTSNVFSQGVGVLIREQDKEEFESFFAEHLENLHSWLG